MRKVERNERRTNVQRDLTKIIVAFPIIGERLKMNVNILEEMLKFKFVVEKKKN